MKVGLNKLTPLACICFLGAVSADAAGCSNFYFNLWDGDDDKVVREIDNGEAFPLEEWEFNIEAVAEQCDETVRSMKIEMDGPISKNKRENVAPYMVFGDNPCRARSCPNDYNTNVKGHDWLAGSYTVTATAYSKKFRSGSVVDTATISFTVGQKPVGQKPVASWTSGGINYVWDDEHTEQAFIESGAFQIDVNTITGIKIKPGAAAKPEETVVYLTVPRFFPGVPSTLNKITLDSTSKRAKTNLPLEPFPSWDMQAIGGDCSGLQFIQSMEIDNDGNMWVIDTGRVNIFTENPDNACPPKLLIISTETGEMVDDPYIFPHNVISYTSGFPNDIVIDNERQVAYISDTLDAGLITYDRSNRRSQRFSSPTMSPDGNGGAPDKTVVWNINGVALPQDWAAATVSINGIALTPDGSRVYYSALGGSGLYSVDAAAARTFHRGTTTQEKQEKYEASVEATVVSHGRKVDALDGMAFMCNGELVYGGLNMASVYSWTAVADDSSPPFDSSSVLANNDKLMHWPDTFGFADNNDLWFTSNFLHELFTTGVAGPVYLFKVPTPGSYQSGKCGRKGE